MAAPTALAEPEADSITRVMALMTDRCHEAGSVQNGVLFQSRPAAPDAACQTDRICQELGSIPSAQLPTYFSCCQPCDTTSLRMAARDKLAQLQSSGPARDALRDRLLALLTTIASDEHRLRENLLVVHQANASGCRPLPFLPSDSTSLMLFARELLAGDYLDAFLKHVAAVEGRLVDEWTAIVATEIGERLTSPART